jgi:hypothetical protein
MKKISYLLILLTLFCKESERFYETNVEITRKDVVVYDNEKNPWSWI